MTGAITPFSARNSTGNAVEPATAKFTPCVLLELAFKYASRSGIPADFAVKIQTSAIIILSAHKRAYKT